MDLLSYQWFCKHSEHQWFLSSSEYLAVLRDEDQENGIKQLHEREEQASNDSHVLGDLGKKDRELEEGNVKFGTWLVEGLIWQLAYVDL